MFTDLLLFYHFALLCTALPNIKKMIPKHLSDDSLDLLGQWLALHYGYNP